MGAYAGGKQTPSLDAGAWPCLSAFRSCFLCVWSETAMQRVWEGISRDGEEGFERSRGRRWKSRFVQDGEGGRAGLTRGEWAQGAEVEQGRIIDAPPPPPSLSLLTVRNQYSSRSRSGGGKSAPCIRGSSSSLVKMIIISAGQTWKGQSAAGSKDEIRGNQTNGMGREGQIQSPKRLESSRTGSHRHADGSR